MILKNMKDEKQIQSIARKIKLIVFDFDGVFTDNKVLVLQNGTEGVFCNRSDGLGLSAVKKQGIITLVISTEINSVVSVRCKKLGIKCIQGCDNKLKILLKEARKLNIKLDEIAFLGNDINDLDCLNKVGFPGCVADSHPDVLRVCQYVTKHSGGNGAVREFCDFIVRVKNERLS